MDTKIDTDEDGIAEAARAARRRVVDAVPGARREADVPTEHVAPPQGVVEALPGAREADALRFTPDGDPSIPGPPEGYTEQRIGSLVLERLFDRKPQAMRIGRFLVLERIGRGGMGTVYAAYDEQLDRKVAVKVLESPERAGDIGQRRLLREAQAMARLSHPNVVTVHEVGESDDGVFVAMEFIRGQSLDAWIRGEPGWREVLEVFVQAGRGMIAAHEAGLVHRDLKPHNMMRAEDGVVKVLDFGLAREVGSSTAGGDDSEGSVEKGSSPDTEPSVGSSAESGSRSSRSGSGSSQSGRSGPASALGTALTRTGAVLGTPAYMAPEQFRGQLVDARSDQFSFCVALYEALYRRRPFTGTTLAALVQAVTTGEQQPAPTDGRVPAWVLRVVLRGLSLEPEKRWPSMRALVQAMERDPSRARRRWWTVAGLGALAGVLGFAIAELRADGPAQCPGEDVELGALWSEDRQQRIAAAFEASGSPLASDTLTRVSPTIEAYVGALGSMRARACEAHRRGEQSERLFDLRTACLDVRRAGLDELLGGFEGADAATVSNAAWAVASLPSVEACGDTEALTAAVPPPEDAEVARRVQQAREVLASAASQVLAGAYDEASTRVKSTLQQAEELGYAPLVAEAQLGLGAALMEAHQFEPALEALSAGLVAALRCGHDEAAVEALARRMWILADPLRRPGEALGDDEIADALIDKLGRPTQLQWLLLNNRGVARFRMGQRAGAEQAYREALGALEPGGEQVYPVQHISTRFNLAKLLSEGLGEPAAAADELRSARNRALELLGPDHPRVAVIATGMAANLAMAGQHQQAREELDAQLALPSVSGDANLRAWLLLERAIVEIDRRRYTDALADARALALVGVDELESTALVIEANARIGLGDVDTGLGELPRAVALEVERFGPHHAAVAKAHTWAGYGLHLAGRLDEAAAELERARKLFAGLGLDAPSHLGREFERLVVVQLERGELFRAEELLHETRRAQDDAGFATDNFYRALVTKLEGDLHTVRGNTAGALAAYRAACPGLAAKLGPLARELAECRLAHARTLGPSEQGRALAQQAREAYAKLGEGFSAERAEADALVAASDGARPPP
jgi:serine/threonine protein kinase/tetratricopeptide (TPR) repeat protein